jgi:protein TonB
MRQVLASLCAAAALLSAVGARAESLDQVRRGFAQMVYEDSREDINLGAPQPLLRAVVVLRVRTNERGRWSAEVMRENNEQPELTRKALASVEHLPRALDVSAPLSEQLRRDGFVEVWLFQNDGRFALKTLALPQRGL